HIFSSRLIKDCNEVIKYFKKSHQPNAYLQQAINELNISGGGLKKFIDTRWVSAYECTLSVSRLERAFIKIINENPDLITNRSVKQILKKAFFFVDLKILVKILAPIRAIIMNLEAQSTTLADCFLQFVR
ncbi:188_t:CDS:2, partial [Racocetra persica]